MDAKARQLNAVGEEQEEKFLSQGGLMGAPVGYQNTIIAPVNINGSIWIYGLDPNARGETLWKSHLCEEPTTGANAWTAINLSIDGSDVMVSCGWELCSCWMQRLGRFESRDVTNAVESHIVFWGRRVGRESRKLTLAKAGVRTRLSLTVAR